MFSFRKLFEEVLFDKKDFTVDIINELDSYGIEYENSGKLIIKGKRGIEKNDSGNYLKIDDKVINSIGKLQKKKVISETVLELVTSKNYLIEIDKKQNSIMISENE